MNEKKYRVKSWIPVEGENKELMTKEDAQGELEQLESLQPENRYEIEEVTEEEFWKRRYYKILEMVKNALGPEAAEHIEAETGRL